MSRYDDQVRELFKWVKNEEIMGVEYAALATEIGNRAEKRHGLRPKSRLLIGRTFEIAVADTDLVIRHDGVEWQLFEPGDMKA